MIPEKMDPLNGMLLEHLARYYFSVEYANGRVLDIASGTGYGTIPKAQRLVLKEIVVVDNDEETFRYARAKHYHSLIQYMKLNAEDTELPQKLGQFDVILSFETLEHLSQEEIFMNNLYTMLNQVEHLLFPHPLEQAGVSPQMSTIISTN